MLGPEPVKVVRSAIDEALELLQDTPYGKQKSVTTAESPQSLLDQCMAMCEAHRAAEGAEPIRVIHHFACTGGSLFSKCIATSQNTRLISEVAPFSKLALGDKGRFFPTDLIRLANVSTRGASQDLIREIFSGGLRAIYHHSRKRAEYLVLREHSHSVYCFGETIDSSPTLEELVRDVAPYLSIVTVRHPADSYLSLCANGWRHFKPATLEEYCKRYLRFLEDNSGVKIFRYEDFVADPCQTVEGICEMLSLPFNPEFENVFPVLNMSGDSGRQGTIIKTRSRRGISDGQIAEFDRSISFRQLCRSLGYSADIARNI